MTRWEYKLWQVPAGGFRGGKIEGAQVVQGLNALGAEGWELVGMTETNYYEGATRDLFFVFKREMDGRTPVHPPTA
jgi:hypothetical protein